jgi:hypothetical protein
VGGYDVVDVGDDQLVADCRAVLVHLEIRLPLCSSNTLRHFLGPVQVGIEVLRRGWCRHSEGSVETEGKNRRQSKGKLTHG